MKKFLKFISAPFLGKSQFQSFFEILFLISLRGLNIGGGGEFENSGEKWVMGFSAKNFKGKKFVLFDVGANIGGYAKNAADIFKQKKIAYEIFCFEPSVATFKKLSSAVSPDPNIKIYNIALSKEAGKATLFTNEPASGLASLYDRDLKSYGITLGNKEEVSLECLDNFCFQNKIENIDFLKLDVEGNELKVLEGAGRMVSGKKIKYIQFEFGGTDIDARVYFKDFYNLLSTNYKLYRILKNGIREIKNYNEIQEIFSTTNFLAVLK